MTAPLSPRLVLHREHKGKTDSVDPDTTDCTNIEQEQAAPSTAENQISVDYSHKQVERTTLLETLCRRTNNPHCWMPEERKRHKENDWKNVREVAWQHGATRHTNQRPSRLRYTNTNHIRERRRSCIPYMYVDLRFRTREKTVLYTIYDSEIYCNLLFEYLPARCPFEAVIFLKKFVVNFRHFVKKKF
jgi:hypothetical protein